MLAKSKIFFRKSAEDRMTRFNISVIVKCRKDNNDNNNPKYLSVFNPNVGNTDKKNLRTFFMQCELTVSK